MSETTTGKNIQTLPYNSLVVFATIYLIRGPLYGIIPTVGALHAATRPANLELPPPNPLHRIPSRSCRHPACGLLPHIGAGSFDAKSNTAAVSDRKSVV